MTPTPGRSLEGLRYALPKRHIARRNKEQVEIVRNPLVTIQKRKKPIPIRRFMKSSQNVPSQQLTDAVPTHRNPRWAWDMAIELINAHDESNWVSRWRSMSPDEQTAVYSELVDRVYKFDQVDVTCRIIQYLRQAGVSYKQTLLFYKNAIDPRSSMFGEKDLLSLLVNESLDAYARNEMTTAEMTELLCKFSLEEKFFIASIHRGEVDAVRLGHHIVVQRQRHIDAVRDIVSHELSARSAELLLNLILSHRAHYNEEILRYVEQLCRGFPQVPMDDERMSDGEEEMIHPGPENESEIDRLGRILHERTLYRLLSKEERVTPAFLEELINRLRSQYPKWKVKDDDSVCSHIQDVLLDMGCEPSKMAPLLRLTKECQDGIHRTLVSMTKVHLKHIVMVAAQMLLHASATKHVMMKNVDNRLNTPEESLPIILLMASGMTQNETFEALNSANLSAEFSLSEQKIKRTNKTYKDVLRQLNSTDVRGAMKAQLDRVLTIRDEMARAAQTHAKNPLRRFKASNFKIGGYFYCVVALFYAIKLISPLFSYTHLAERVDMGLLTQLFPVDEAEFSMQFQQDVRNMCSSIRSVVEGLMKVEKDKVKRRKSKCLDPCLLTTRQRLLNAERGRARDESNVGLSEMVEDSMDVDSLETTTGSNEKYTDRINVREEFRASEDRRKERVYMGTKIVSGKRKMVSVRSQLADDGGCGVRVPNGFKNSSARFVVPPMIEPFNPVRVPSKAGALSNFGKQVQIIRPR